MSEKFNFNEFKKETGKLKLISKSDISHEEIDDVLNIMNRRDNFFDRKQFQKALSDKIVQVDNLRKAYSRALMRSVNEPSDEIEILGKNLLKAENELINLRNTELGKYVDRSKLN